MPTIFQIPTFIQILEFIGTFALPLVVFVLHLPNNSIGLALM